MKTLRSYQREAVERIYKFFNSDLNKAKICMSTGLGKTAIIASAIDKILEKHDKEQKLSLIQIFLRCGSIGDAGGP